jgi:hypothetical protein
VAHDVLTPFRATNILDRTSLDSTRARWLGHCCDKPPGDLHIMRAATWVGLGCTREWCCKQLRWGGVATPPCMHACICISHAHFKHTHAHFKHTHAHFKHTHAHFKHTRAHFKHTHAHFNHTHAHFKHTHCAELDLTFAESAGLGGLVPNAPPFACFPLLCVHSGSNPETGGALYR